MAAAKETVEDLRWESDSKKNEMRTLGKGIQVTEEEQKETGGTNQDGYFEAEEQGESQSPVQVGVDPIDGYLSAEEGSSEPLSPAVAPSCQQRYSSGKEFVWFEEEMVKGGDLAVPVRETREALEEMIRARSYIDEMVSTRPEFSNYRGKRLGIELSAIIRAFESAENNNSFLESLLRRPTTFLLDESTSTFLSKMIIPVPEKDSAKEIYMNFLRERVVSINHGTRKRVTSIRNVAQSIRNTLLNVDASLQHSSRLQALSEDTWITFVAQTLRFVSFADEVTKHFLLNTVMKKKLPPWLAEARSGFEEFSLASADGLEEEVLTSLIEQYGDVSFCVKAGWFGSRSEIFTTGFQISGNGTLLLRRADSEQTIRLPVEIQLECSVLDSILVMESGGDFSPEKFRCSIQFKQRPNLISHTAIVHASNGSSSASSSSSLANQPGSSNSLTSPDSKGDLDAIDEPEMFLRHDIARLRVKPNQRYPYSVQLFSWGKNESSVLGIGSSKMGIFTKAMPVAIWGVLEFARVCKVSCGWFHCAAITDMGLVYTWGSGSDGALGHGETSDLDMPRMVEALGGTENPTLVIDISCGSDLAGSHTACVSREGHVYTWGLGSALGHGDTSCRYTPTQVSSSEFDGELVDGIACGGGFCVAVTCKGKAFSWGSWLYGRLGLGTPDKREHRGFLSRRVARQERQVARFRGSLDDERTAYQRFRLRPRRIMGILKEADVVQVSCGEAHCLARDMRGRIFAWGKGSHGQLGVGRLQNLFEPRQIEHYLDHASEELKAMPFVNSVSCGANHSLAIDSNGRAFSWGGLGSPALGHGSSVTNWNVKVNSSFVVGDKRTKSDSGNVGSGVESPNEGAKDQSVPYIPTMEEEQPWRWPQVLLSLSDPVTSLSGGCKHSASVSSDGSIYVWGQQGLENGNSCSEPRLVRDRSLRGLCGDFVSCGGWHTVVSTSGGWNAQVFKGLLDALSSRPSSQLLIVEPDLKICVGSRNLYGHCVIAAARSTELRRLIEMESTEFIDESNGMKTVMLPQVSVEGGRILLEYLYGDNIFSRMDPMTSIADEVMALARKLGLKRLEALCARSQLVESAMFDDSDEEADVVFRNEDEEEANKNEKDAAEHAYRQGLLADELLLESTFDRDLELFLNEPSWSNIIFRTSDDKKLFAHAAIVLPRCPHFRSAWRGKAQTETALSIKVNESQSVFLRFLAFVYTGKILSSSADELFEDIETAYKYRMLPMLSRCQDALELTKSSAIRALLVGMQTRSMSLQTRAVHFIVENLTDLSQTKSFLRIQKINPEAVQLIFRQAKASSAFKRIYTEQGVLSESSLSEDDPEKLLHRVLRTEEQREKEKLERENAELLSSTLVPLRWALILILVSVTYAYFMSSPALLSLVPYTNGAGALVSLAAVGYTLSR